MPPDPPSSSGLHPLRMLFAHLRPYRLRAACAIFTVLIAAGTVLAIGFAIRELVDSGFQSGDPTILDRALGGLLGVLVLLACAIYARFYLVSWLGERVVADIRKKVFAHAMALSPSFFEHTRTGEVVSRLAADTTLIQNVVASTISIALRNLLLLFGGSALLIVTNARLTGLVVLVVPLILVPILVLGRYVRRLARRAQDRVGDLSAQAEESVGAVRTVQAFNHEPQDIGTFADKTEDAFAAAVDWIRVRAALIVAVIVLSMGSVSVILWFGGREVIGGAITPGELTAFVFYAVIVAGAVGALSEVVGDLQRAAGATERLMELLATEPEIQAPAMPVALPEPARGEISLEDVNFLYPARQDAPALHDFNLRVEPGERLALVGPSGAGKTTLFNLLLRYYDPQEGTVRLDGVDLRQADPGAVRRRFGTVPQEPFIFSASAADNIRFGNPDASDDEVRRAAETAAAAEFIEDLSEGYDTYLGERGVRLSGGQRQRLALARAILRNPPVLLLDEATSALDSENERLIQAALDRLSRDRTTIVIAHRLSTVVNATRIAVMDKGRLVATGAHVDLLAQGGLYSHLAELQFFSRAPDDADDDLEVTRTRFRA